VHTTPHVIESQVDWLTVIGPDDRQTLALRHTALSLQALEQGQGMVIRPFVLLGYAGQQCGRVRWGIRADRCLVQVSGEMASDYLDALVAVADKVTRIDVAVTVQYRGALPSVASDHYKVLTSPDRPANLRGMVKLVTDSLGGETVYVNQRSAETFLRCYNKEREDPRNQRYLRCYRYECECKGGSAVRVVSNRPGVTDRPAWCASLVHDLFSRRGFVLDWQPANHYVLRRGFSRRADNTRRLEWLRRQVKPVIAQLFADGKREATFDALGLADVSNIGGE